MACHWTIRLYGSRSQDNYNPTFIHSLYCLLESQLGAQLQSRTVLTASITLAGKWGSWKLLLKRIPIKIK